MRVTLLFLLAGLIISCRQQAESVVVYRDGQQVLNVNKVNINGDSIEEIFIKTLLQDTVSPGDEFYAELFLSNPTLKVINAYFDCGVSNQSVADTLKQGIIGCRKELVVERDTVRIAFTVGEVAGLQNFIEVILLSRDTLGIYRYHNGSFKYFVNPK